jgi:hypothetical protein
LSNEASDDASRAILLNEASNDEYDSDDSMPDLIDVEIESEAPLAGYIDDPI